MFDSTRWLDQVAADRGLSPLAFRVAFAIVRELGAGAAVLASRRAKRLAVAAGADGFVLDELVKRGHVAPLRQGAALAAVLQDTGRKRRPVRPAAAATATLIPFPADRRCAFVRTQAARIAEMSTESGNAYLRNQLMQQGKAMRRKGIDDALIAATLRTLESAIRAELFRQVITPSLPPGGDIA